VGSRSFEFWPGTAEPAGRYAWDITEHTETAGWLAWLFLRAEVRAAGSTLVVHGRDARDRPRGQHRHLAGQARRTLAAPGVGNVVVLAGDRTGGAPAVRPVRRDHCLGLPSRAIAAGRPAHGAGRLVQPAGPRGADRVVLYQKKPNGLRRVPIAAASFARLDGSGPVSPAEP